MASEKNKSEIKVANNRYTAASSKEESVTPDLNEMLLNIMKDEYPDDVLYANDRLKPASPDRQARDSFKSSKDTVSPKLHDMAIRNKKNVLDVSTEKSEFATYPLLKTYPTVDEDILDDLIDEEWEYFEDDEEAPPTLAERDAYRNEEPDRSARSRDLHSDCTPASQRDTLRAGRDLVVQRHCEGPHSRRLHTQAHGREEVRGLPDPATQSRRGTDQSAIPRRALRVHRW